MQGIMRPSACLQNPRHVQHAVPTLDSRCVAGIGSLQILLCRAQIDKLCRLPTV